MVIYTYNQHLHMFLYREIRLVDLPKPLAYKSGTKTKTWKNIYPMRDQTERRRRREKEWSSPSWLFFYWTRYYDHEVFHSNNVSVSTSKREGPLRWLGCRQAKLKRTEVWVRSLRRDPVDMVNYPVDYFGDGATTPQFRLSTR